jgi:hypothetical protein
MPTDLASLTAEDFRACLEAQFSVPEGPIECELIEVNEFAGEVTSAPRAPFAVVFRGPLEPFLPQGMHRFEHEALGSLDLFLVPIGPDDGAMRYEAVFG